MGGMGDIEAIARIVLSQRQTLLTLVVTALVLVPLSTVAARRVGWSWWRVGSAGFAGLGTALVLAVTIGRYENGVLLTWHLRCLVQPGLSLSSPEEKLNFLLMAPACFFGVLALRRYLPVVGLAVVLSLFVEAVQSVTGIGTCQTSDVVRNVAGAAVAGLVALACVLPWESRSRLDSRERGGVRCTLRKKSA